MPFRNPVTTLPADAITGKINPTTQLDAGQLAPGVTYATSPTVGDGTAQGYGVIIDSSGIRAYKATDVTPVFLLDSSNGNTTVQEGGSLTVQGGGSLTVVGGSLYVTPSTQDRPGLTAGAAANGGDQLRWVPQVHATVLGTGPYAGPKHSHIIRAYQTVDTTFAAGASPDNKNVLLLQAQDANSGSGNPATLTLTAGSTNSPTSVADVTATAFTVNGQGLWGGAQIITGTPSGVAGISGAAGINTANVPAFPYETVQSVRMGNFISSQTVSTDTFDFYLRKDGVNQERARCQGGGLSGAPVVMDFDVPANTAVTYQNVAQRATGTGTMTSTADGSLNYLQVTIRRVSAA